MTSPRAGVFGVLALPVLMCLACRPADHDAEQERVSQSSVQAEQTLARFLDSQRADHYERDKIIELTLEECEPAGAVEPRFWLADARVLGSESRGDTVLVSVEIVTVAAEEEDSTPDGRVVYLATLRDTATWKLIASEPRGSWSVCGISDGGVDFVAIGDTTLIRWGVNGQSLGQAHTALDSVRASASQTR